MNRPTPPDLLTDPLFPFLKEHVIARSGLAYYADKDGDLARLVAGRLTVLGLAHCSAYLDVLTAPVAGQVEFDELVKELTIGETYFFRHEEMFEALRATVLPALIARNRQQRRLRIWSAGCSTGAEAYSVSILLRRDLGLATAGWDVSIVGTDVNRAVLAAAGAAVFEEWALRATPDDVRRDCFHRQGRSWAIDPRFAQGVSFQYHNLVADPFPSQLNNLFAFDLILCRNVLIYFDRAQVRRCLDGLRHSLVEGGWLLVGHAEPNVELFRPFRTVNSHGVVLYQKAPPAECHPSPGLGASVVPPGEPGGFPAPPAIALEDVRTFADRGDWDRALRGCLGLLSADKLSPVPHLYHGLILEQIGRHDEAEAALRRAIYLDRRFALAHYYLGLLQHRCQHNQEAARSFQNALDLLERLSPGHVFADADGITAAELARLARMQLDVARA